MKKSTPAQLAARLIIYCVGLAVLAFGIALSVNCNLGVSPVSSLPYVVSQILNISLGTCTTIIYALYVLIQMALMGRIMGILRKHLSPLIRKVCFGECG